MTPNQMWRLRRVAHQSYASFHDLLDVTERISLPNEMQARQRSEGAAAMTFCDHRHVKRTRKPYRCVWCGEPIDAEQSCDVLSGLTEDGEIASNRYHPECYAALRTLPRDEWDSWDWGDFLRGCTCQAGTQCRCKTREGQP